MRHPLLLALLIAPLATAASGCVALAAGAAGGLLISQEVLKGHVHVAHIHADVDQVWPAAQSTMTTLSIEAPEIVEYPRTIKGKVHGADVLLEVEAYDMNHTVVRIDAKKYMVGDSETAEHIMQNLLERLERSR